MTEAKPPLIAFVGFKRSKLAMAGGIRLLVARDGRVRILGKEDRVDLDEAIEGLTARLTKTKTVELRSDSGSVIIYGMTDRPRIHKDLDNLAVRELETTVVDGKHNALVVGPGPTGFTPMFPLKDLLGQVKASRAVADGLHERGAREA